MSGSVLNQPLTLPCGATLKNRIAKSAMSDSLGDGTGHPSAEQIQLYGRWADGGLALGIIGEVQITPDYPEKPGNLVLHGALEDDRFHRLTQAGSRGHAQLWAQLGHAGAMADPQISAPKGPSALDVPGLSCGALSDADIAALPAQFAAAAHRAQTLGFAGVEVHAAHGFLLSQFLSPLFNTRRDGYGGPLENRMRLLVEVIGAVRAAVGPDFPIGVKLNATDQLDGGFAETEALEVVAALDQISVDLIDISGGTYFPGAASSSDRAGSGPYFLNFAQQARSRTHVPLMVTGGFKTRTQAEAAIAEGRADVIGLARALILDPDLPRHWCDGTREAPAFPRFDAPPEGGVTAWYTMQITRLATGAPDMPADALQEAIAAYETRDTARRAIWAAHFGRGP